MASDLIAGSQPVRALIDTNVALDWILDRKPWSDEARPLWDARDTGRVVCYLPASVLTDVFISFRRSADIPIAFSALDQIFVTFGLFPVDAALLLQARSLPGNDFEDNAQIACAANAGLDVIISRNQSDFRHSPLLVIEPLQIAEYIARRG